MTLKIESLPIDKLTFDPSNARKHSDVNLSAIAESLKQFGQRKPIVITADNVIVAGNGTVEAARFLGLTDIDVVRVPKDWSADQVKAFALADNRTAELAEWDDKVLQTQLAELLEAGFESCEVSKAFDWLDSLNIKRTIKPTVTSAFRIFCSQEIIKLNLECRNFILFLEQNGILNSDNREVVIDRVMALDIEDISMDKLKWIVLMVLLSQPDEEIAFSRMEDIVYDLVPTFLH